jgi:hypothetical protein
MKGVLISTMACLACLVILAGNGEASDLSLGIEGGLSTVVGYDYKEYFDAGYCLGGSVFYTVHPNIAIGARGRYHSWQADGRPYDFTCAEGSASALEIVPTLRLMTSPSALEPAVIFLQIGAGYASIKSDAEKWSIPDLPEDPVGPREPVIDPESNTVLSFGAGISIDTGIGFDLEFLPVFEYIFTDADALMHVSANLGLSFGI